MAFSRPALSFQNHDASFEALAGSQSTVTLLAEDELNRPLFHEACIYHRPSKSVFITSNRLRTQDGSEHVKLFRVYDDGHATKNPSASALVEDVTPPGLARSMLNGGVNFDDSSFLMCAQGSLSDDDPSGVMLLQIPTARCGAKVQSFRSIITSFYGRSFNSVNDVILHPQDGSIWFTDPCYGFHQGIRPPPQLPTQVYRFDPGINSIRAMADGFTRCNGLAFSPDCTTLYITDTGATHGKSTIPFDPTGRSHIYAFDVSITDSGTPMLVNRRLFAFADGGCPDGIKCDLEGNVYSGCSDGVEVWNRGGVLIGRILVEGGVSNFCFGEPGVIYLCNESRLWKIQMDARVTGALLKL